MNRPLAVEHNERILIELDSDLLLGSFCSLGHECGWHGFLLPISLCFLTVRSNCSLSWDPHHQREFLKGGSDPRSEDTSEAGLWRLDRPQTGVAPALFMTPRAVLCRPRLLVEVVFSPLVTDDNRRTIPRTASRTKPTVGMVR